MVNKEDRPQGFIISACIIKIITSGFMLFLLTAGSGAFAPALLTYLVAVHVVCVVLAGLFLWWKHPAFGILGTSICALHCLLVGLVLFLVGPSSHGLFSDALTVAILWSIFAALAALTVFYGFADYQAVVLRRLEREREA